MKRLSDDEWKRETRKFGHNDRKPKPYHRDERKDFKRDDRNDRRPFNRDRNDRDDRRPFNRDRDDRKPFNRDRNGRDDRKPFNRDRKRDDRQQGRPISDRGPSISKDKAQVINPVYFRKRKEKPTEED